MEKGFYTVNQLVNANNSAQMEFEDKMVLEKIKNSLKSDSEFFEYIKNREPLENQLEGFNIHRIYNTEHVVLQLRKYAMCDVYYYLSVDEKLCFAFIDWIDYDE